MSSQRTNEDHPIYTIGTVARRLGVATNTLRSWEDRYQAVVPARDASGRRRYSERDLSDLEWLRDRIAEGLSTAEAHEMLSTRQTSEPVLPILPVLPVESGAASPYVAFSNWVASHRPTVRPILEELRRATRAISAFVVVNLPHPEFGLTSSLVVRATLPDRMTEHTLARFVGVAWSELPEAARVLERGEVCQFRFSELDESGRALFEPTDLRSEVNAPIHRASVWIGTVGLAARDERVWSADDERLLERARDLIDAEFRAWEARSRFDTNVQAESPDRGDERPHRAR